MKRPLLVAGGVIVTGGLAAVAYGWLFGDYRTLKDHRPDDAAPAPGKTGYRLVDALLPKLRAIAQAAAGGGVLGYFALPILLARRATK